MSMMAKPWHAFYPTGVRATIEQAPFATLAQFAKERARTFGMATAFTCMLPNGMSGSLTFAEIDRLSDAFAVYLREVAGLKVGDRVAVQLPNSLSYPVVAFGTFKAGCVLVNVNPLYTADEMAHSFADSKPNVLVIIDLFADKLTAALAKSPVPHVVIASIAEFFPVLRKTLIGFVQKYVKKQIPACAVPAISMGEAIASGRGRHSGSDPQIAAYSKNVMPNDLVCLQYTGGTTGVSKAAMLSNANLIMNMAQVTEMIGTHLVKGQETVLTALPLYHIFAFTCNLLCFFDLGGHNVLIPSPRPLLNLKPAFDKLAITWMTGVNTLFNGLLNEEWFRNNPPRSLKGSSAGGMALHSAVAERWTKLLGTPVIEGYGLSEASPVLSFNPFGRVKADTIGVPMPSTDMRCVDDDGNEVALGMPGEIIAKGPQVMLGYWQRQDETANVLKDGWLYTGDIGVMDSDGYIKIVDRKKDMIIVSGFKVFPNEVEDCLAKLPSIQEAAVIGVPDAGTGEAVKAFIVRKSPELTSEEVRKFCQQHLTAYKVPKQVEFRDDLPKSNVGKILRKELRQKAK